MINETDAKVPFLTRFFRAVAEEIMNKKCDNTDKQNNNRRNI